jgi:hypothetical protein
VNVDVFDMFGDDDDKSDRSALATAPGRESTDHGYDRDDGPGGRRGGRTLLVVIIAGVLVAGLIGAVSWFIGRRLSSDPPAVSCSAQDRADQQKLRDWLQQHTDAGLAGQSRDVAAVGCAPGEVRPGAWVALVDDEELKGMTAALAESDCALTGTDPAKSAKGKQTCTVDVDGLKADIAVVHAEEGSLYGDFELTVIRKQTAPAA